MLPRFQIVLLHRNDRVEHNSDASPTDSLSYRFYKAGERMRGKTMEEWIRPAVSFTSFTADGCDWAGRPTFNRSWDDQSNSIENYKRRIKACFEFCNKIGVKYWTAFDSDLVPHSETLEEYKTNCDEIAEFVQENTQRAHLRPLWIAPDLHSHARYASGAATSSEANVYLHAATQVKRSMELAHRLNSECYLIWPLREGYDAIIKSDVAREMKLFAKLLKMAAEYKDRTAYRGQFLIKPYCDSQRSMKLQSVQNGWQQCDSDVNRYMWDATSCLYFLKHFNLDRCFKVVVPPGHQMFLANAYNMLGGMDISTIPDGFDQRTLTLAMKSVIDQGCLLDGGTTLNLVPQRHSTEPRDLMTCYVSMLDNLGQALRSADQIANDQHLIKYLQQRYATYCSGYGARLAASDVTLEECEEHAKKCQHHASAPGLPGETVTSSRHEHWQTVLQRYCSTAAGTR